MATSKHKTRNGDPGSPILIGDSSSFPGKKNDLQQYICFSRVAPQFFTRVSDTQYQVSARDENGVIERVQVPGVDPFDIGVPWRLLFGNGIKIVAPDDDLITFIFPTAPQPTGDPNKPTMLCVPGSMQDTVRSVAVFAPSGSHLVSVLAGDGVEIDFQAQVGRKAMFARPKSGK